MYYAKKLNMHWFCTQNHILEPFSVRRACTKSYVTSEPYPRASKCAGNSKEKSHKVSRRELCALQSNRTKYRGGGPKGPPPSLFRVKLLKLEMSVAAQRKCIPPPPDHCEFSYIICHNFCVQLMENCEAMTSSTHSFAYSYRQVKKL